MQQIIPVATASAVARFTSLPPLSLYIHFPWCVRKCPYCDFNSHESTFDEAAYVNALIADLELALPTIWGRRISSVFIGGGTPSLLSGAAVDSLLADLRARLTIDADAEITLEANPGTVEATRFKAYREAGVTRLSLGIQSFNDHHLRALGRIHDSREAHAAVEMALAVFENINLDLMYALPQQSLHQAESDLKEALSYTPQHLSAYHLTLEPNTAFAAAPPPLPNDDVAADMQEMVEETLIANGYAHYETSAFAKPRKRCRHNLNYWHFGDYLGIGAGAHSKITRHDGVVRQMRWKNPRDYLRQLAQGSTIQEEHSVSGRELPFEFMMNALRLIEGVDAALFPERTGLPLLVVRPSLDKAMQRGLLICKRSPDGRECLRPTLQGSRFLNELLQTFLQ